MDLVLKKLLERYRNHERIYAWDIINEPEWAMTNVTGLSQRPKCVDDTVSILPIDSAQMTDFVKEATNTIHMMNATQPVTVGSARKMWLSQFWTDASLKLDLYQFHWYD